MSRLIDIEVDAGRVCIIFPFDRTLLPVVRSLPERWFDGGTKNWYVPLKHVQHVIGKLSSHHFKLSAELRSYCEEHLDPVDELVADGPHEGGSQDGGPLEVPDGTYSISELNQGAKLALRETFSDDVWLVGEVQSYDRNRGDGHAYFELVERLAADEDPVARIRVVSFRDDRQKIIDVLQDAPEAIRLRDGLAVRLSGRVDLYAPHGAYQFIARGIDPAYTTGEIHQNRERIIKRLDTLDIRQNNKNLEWPSCPLRVGLITSYESDAYNDFVHELERSELGFELTVHNANVQGSRTEASVLRGLEYFAGRDDDFDVVVIVRGGGSRSDLAYFDTESIGKAVCEHPLKIVTGVGHQRDQCLLDFISDSQKTPTAAANACVTRVGAFLERAETIFSEIAERAVGLADTEMSRLRQASVRLERAVERCLKVETRRLGQVRSAVIFAAKDRMIDGTRRLDGFERIVSSTALAQLTGERQRLAFATRQMSIERLTRRFDRDLGQLDTLERRLQRGGKQVLSEHDRRLKEYEQRLRLLDPQRVLERGFAIVQTDGGVARRPQDVAFDTDLTVRLAQGRVVVQRVDGGNNKKSLTDASKDDP
jgi:exodeoxyribonuclease VII large subunit